MKKTYSQSVKYYHNTTWIDVNGLYRGEDEVSTYFCHNSNKLDCFKADNSNKTLQLFGKVSLINEHGQFYISLGYRSLDVEARTERLVYQCHFYIRIVQEKAKPFPT